MFTSITLSLAGLVALGHGAPLQARSGASAYCSDASGNYKLSSISAPVQGSGSPGSESTWSFTIDDTSSGYKQKVTGFGAAVTDATVSVFNSLSSSQLSALLNDLLTTSGSDGAGFSLFRHTIGASDLSADPAYTYDDNGGNVDTDLSGFNLGGRGDAMAQLLAKMQSINSNVEILGSSWSAPGWMKLNGVIDGNTNDNNLADGYYEPSGPNYSSSFAQYFVKYIQAFANYGAKISAITIQNEPLNSQSGYPTMYVYAQESAQLINDYVGPALKNAGLDTAVWAYDHNTDVPDYPQTVLDNAADYVNTVAWHCYANPLDWSVLTTFHDNNPDVTQYMTECWTSPQTSWWQAANFTIGPLMNWGSGAMAWTLGTTSDYGPHLSSGGCSDCRGLVTTSNGGYEFQVDYYMMAQFSRFIPRGATVLSGTGSYLYNSNAGVESVATINPDGTRTVVILNLFSNDVYVSLSTKSGEEWSGNVPEQSVVTWLLPASS